MRLADLVPAAVGTAARLMCDELRADTIAQWVIATAVAARPEEAIDLGRVVEVVIPDDTRTGNARRPVGRSSTTTLSIIRFKQQRVISLCRGGSSYTHCGWIIA